MQLTKLTTSTSDEDAGNVTRRSGFLVLYLAILSCIVGGPTRAYKHYKEKSINKEWGLYQLWKGERAGNSREPIIWALLQQHVHNKNLGSFMTSPWMRWLKSTDTWNICRTYPLFSSDSLSYHISFKACFVFLCLWTAKVFQCTNRTLKRWLETLK